MISLKKWMKFMFAVLAVSSWALNAEAQRTNRQTIVLHGPSTQGDPGGFLDLKTGTVHSLESATNNQGDIDLMYVVGRNTGANLLSPRSSRIKGFGRYRRGVQDVWETKNRTFIIRLPDDRKSRRAFRRARNNDRLEKAYHDGVETVKALSDYKSVTYGPLLSLSRLKVGDYLMFRSGARNRNVYAIAEVKAIEPGYRGSITLDIKTTGN